ncbi:MAG: hypothetical protein LBT94_06840 [Prevotellaceae bacterium]|jgi:hypothetical protein|nr:hypothetical protein [Prevotellaceae bacterium]
MKTFIISLLSAIAFTAEAYAQAPHHPDDFGKHLVSIYEHGKSLDCCEANFENLLKSWIPKHIFNAKASGSAGADDFFADGNGKEHFVASAQEIEIISYAYVENIKDSALVGKYVNLTFSPSAAVASLLTSTAKVGGQDKADRRYRTAVFLSSYEEALAEVQGSAEKNAYIAEVEKIKTWLYKALLKGAEVYVVKLKYGGKEIDSYAFCNPQTHVVIWDNIFTHIKILP